MAEIELWQERASVLSTLLDQLKEPVVEKILEVMTKTNAGVLHTLTETIAELTKYHLESDEIASLLKTLERHFMVSYLFSNRLFAVVPVGSVFMNKLTSLHEVQFHHSTVTSSHLSLLLLSFAESSHWSKFCNHAGDHPSYDGELADSVDDLLPLQLR